MAILNPEDEKRIEIIKETLINNGPNLQYHNAPHGLDVWNTARNYGTVANLSYDDRVVLESASLLHDFIFVPRRDDNEEKTASFASSFLPSLGFLDYQVSKIHDLIIATKPSLEPKNFLEGLIRDCDLDYLGRQDYVSISEKLREEWHKPRDREWFELQEKFLTGHTYHAEIAQVLRNYGKNRNINLVRKVLKATN